MKIKTINIPIFKGKITFIKSKDFEKTSKKYNLNIPNRYGAVTFRNEKSETFECVVSFVDDNFSLLCHEAVHVCNYIYDNIRAKLCTDNDEFQAYITAWIVDEMMIFLKEK